MPQGRPRPEPGPDPDAIEAVFAYHERTKHHFHRYAAALGYLDWDTQPDPFRRYPGAQLARLRIPARDRTPAYSRIFVPGAVAPRLLSPDTLSEFLYYSMSISAWKAIRENRWALRVNPSSGNLHPTEAYVVADSIEGILPTPGVHHYAPREHGLEQRTEFDPQTCSSLLAGFPEGTFLFALSSIHWREAWKYGERAYRYCQHDVGHAMAAARLSAAMLGWGLVFLDGVADRELARLLGLDRETDFEPRERETPDAVAVVVPCGVGGPGVVKASASLPSEALEAIARAAWHGKANVLSGDHVEWPAIEEVADAAAAPRSRALKGSPEALPSSMPADASDEGPTAGRIVRRRRSAVAMDGRTGLPRARFYAMLARTVPALSAIPWDAVACEPAIHLGLFVHRVSGLVPGLYALARDASAVERLRGAMDTTFSWSPPPARPEGLPLFLLKEGDFRGEAARASCEQAIAGDGAFSLGMLADFEATIRREGAHAYRRLYWEAGRVGQVLYLEAEAAGLRSTGIGCYFDDPVHQLFGLEGRGFQSLYHFTVGGAVDDPRLTTLPAYPEVTEKKDFCEGSET
ncbi:MAG: SagB/ThcOx family dehydrogenase [Planctomycetes bacterium]|nr:SagB/ThcOx family dehydrogenase [Planctomycetota bacterium]